ncbi:hypothetical protein Nepgr_023818 [Nepenthes gracilis]|uniref:Uncharacterized protein n=1 Tax=Nepenthes gracilis TaxID=150966 RepID=A0AAD3XZG5_NEPGR|nr:hypothetical protein Nepgr_023818 [Nepenthes gracilis]
MLKTVSLSLSLSSTTHSNSFFSPKPHNSQFPDSNSFPHDFPFISKTHPLSSNFRAKAKAKELVLANPTITVEKGKYSYDVETLINKLSSLPPRGSIARCLDTFRNKLSLNDFALVFKEFAHRGDWQRSLRLFKYMQRQIWCKPNEQIYTIIIGLLGREGLLDKCQEIFEEMPVNNVVRSVFSYTALINAYGRNGNYETSLELLDRMKKERIPPSILTYNTVINSCAKGGLDWEELLGLFAEMRHEGIQPDIVTYNTLLSACASRGQGDEAEMVFKTMNESRVLPDITTYSYVVETFGKLRKLDKVSELLKVMESEGNLPDISSYNLLLEAYGKEGSIKEAMGVFRQMQAAGCMPNAATYSILLNMYGSQGRYNEVRELFLEMKVSNTDPDVATYNILIEVFCEGGYFKEVVTLFHDMVDENVEPNMVTYEGLIFACGKGGLHEDAKQILLHMNRKGIVPSAKAYTGVIEAYGQAALYEEALVAFNTMNEVGSKPSLETYNSLIHTFARGGLYKESEAILSWMVDSGVPKNRDSFNGVIEGFRQGGQFEEAVKAYVEMQNARCEPDERTLEVVLSVYCFASLVEESEEHFQEIKALGVLPSVMCYCMMLAVFAKNGRLDNALELLDEMLNTRASNIHQVVGQMIMGDFDNESNWQVVEYVFDQLNSEGCGFGMRFYNMLLEALWWLGQKARAARVLNEATRRGLFPELYRRNNLVWSLDVHRLWPGSTCTALSVWLNDIYQMFKDGANLPHLATVIVVRGRMENSSTARDFPTIKAACSFLEDHMPPSSFSAPGWNKGRLVCHRTQLKRLLAGIQQSAESQKGLGERSEHFWSYAVFAYIMQATDPQIESMITISHEEHISFPLKGASSGIGEETTRVLAMRGVHVVMAVRNIDAGKQVKEAILAEIPTAEIDVMELDLSSMASVRKFASQHSSSGHPLNILINNAGIMDTPFSLSKDKIELQFAIIIALFFLCLLMEGIRFQNLNDKSGYNNYSAYGQSKLANILHANELARQLKEQGVNITANSLHPGVIVTNILRHHSFFNSLIQTVGKFVFLNVQQKSFKMSYHRNIYDIPDYSLDTATTCYLALHPQVEGVSGEYFMDCNRATPAPQAKDAELARKLWDFSLSLTDPKVAES